MTGRTLLIVDDDVSLTDSLQDILMEDGYTIWCASSCEEAIRRTRESSPQAALLDLKLPDGSGTELLAEIKQINPDCVCSVITGYADLDSALSALHQGAFHYLQKPVRPEGLLAVLDRVFETIRLRDEKRQAEEKLAASERRFRAISDTAEDGIFIKDSELKYTQVNPATAKLLGVGAAEMIGRTDEEILGVDAAGSLRQIDRRVLSGETVEQEQSAAVDGAIRTLHVIKVPMRDGCGQIVGLCGIARDITERRLLENQLLQAQKMEAVGTLAGGVAHDFNNLLQAIQGYADLLVLDKESHEPGYRELQEILRAADRGKDLTQQLLTFSRKVGSNLSPIDLNSEVDNVRRLLVRTIPKMIHIQLHLEGELRPVNADPAQVEQILMNLAVNARDAMPRGGTLTIATENARLDANFCSAHPELEPGDYVVLSISDTGCGMTDEVLEHVFEPFYTTKGPGSGTGLGLAVVYGIVRNHGGHILCRTQPGHGTTFQVCLPAIDGSSEQRKEAEVETVEGGNEVILVVDDEESVRTLGKRILTRFGYQVITAASGEQALEIHRQQHDRIDLTLLDLIMPGIGGALCLQKLVELHPTAKVLVSSGFTPEGAERELLDSLARGFVEKPYDMRSLLKSIREALDPE